MYRIGYLYRCAGNYKTWFHIDYEENPGLARGQEVTMGEYGTLPQEEFFGSDTHYDEFNEKYDHNLLEVVRIEIHTQFNDDDVVVTIDGNNCIEFVCEEGPYLTATVKVMKATVGSNEVLIKNYSENEGVEPFLRKLGVIGDVVETIRSGHVKINKCKLLI